MSQPVGPDNTATTPTPNNMPGAPAAPQTPPATPPAPEKAPAATTTPAATPEAAQGDTPPVQEPGESNVDWKERARIWEDRAKVKGVTQEALDKAKQWDEYQASKRTKEENDAIAMQAKDKEIAELKTQGLRKDIASEFKMPARFVVGKDEAEMREAAAEYVADRGPAKPTSSAVPADVVTSTDKVEGPKQIESRDELARMSPAQVMDAYREGRLSKLGAVPGQGDFKNLQHAKAAASQGK